MRLTLALPGLLALCACERIDYIELVPSEVVFKQPNNSKYVEARCMARSGVRAVKARVDWSTRDPSIATVDEKGLVKPVADGDTEVIARVGDVEARVPVQVVYVDRVTVEPAELTLKDTDDAATVKVTAYRKSGKIITDRATTFTPKDPAIVRAAGGGALMPLDPGTTTVDVQVDGAKATLTVTVVEDKSKK